MEQEIMNPSFDTLNGMSEPELSRGYLGMSEIGDPCARKIWYSFRQVKKIALPKRIHRIFELGHLLEDYILCNLRKEGFTVYSCDCLGDQFEFKDFGGHFSGHCDLVIEGFLECKKAHMADIKTFNDKRFNAWLSMGVKLSDPTYYDQLTMYAGYAQLEKCALIGYNKNDSSMSYERFNFDPQRFEDLKMKARHVITTSEPPDRAFEKQSDFRCRFCNYSSICWGDEDPVKACKTCEFYNLGEDWKEVCLRNGELKLCEEYVVFGGCPF